MYRRLTVSLVLLLAARIHAAPAPGYHAKVNISAPTRLDWTFVVSNRSLDKPPAEWTPDYDSTKQTYELFVPGVKDRKPLPLILFVSPNNNASGWKNFETICKQQGILFAGPHGAGNDCPGQKRVRIILDVLDDIRRNYPVDPERTYITGFSGGGRIACAVAFALPELFGGAMPLCASGDVREESWLRHRVQDRLSVALLTGQTDFNRGEVERLRGPYLTAVGVRAKVWVQPNLGHGVPGEKTLLEALKWLDEGAAKRQELAKTNPASRLAADAAPTRTEAAKALLAEGKQKLEKRDTQYAGLMLVQGVFQRWPDLPSGDEAKKILLLYEDKKDKPWEAEDIAEQRRFLIARARALDAYASGDLPTQYIKQRPQMARQAADMWKQIVADAPDSEAGREGKKRIPELEKLAGK